MKILCSICSEHWDSSRHASCYALTSIQRGS